MNKLQNKTALITGGSTGMGFATAKLFIEEGAQVIITDIDEEQLNHAVTELGENCRGVLSDTGSMDDIAALMALIKAEYGQLDILFANAGIAHYKPYTEVTEQHFDQTMQVNVKGLYFTVLQAVPLLPEGASVILNTSIANRIGTPGFAVYCASKAAVKSFTQSLAAELLPKKIKVNALSSGAIETGITHKFGLPEGTVEAHEAKALARVPMGRMGEAQECAKVALFLATDDSSFILGSEIVVDGGISNIKAK
ncbi:MAG: glucose 1-dehydrogenase [Algicola sp.]|nr:glucose 1-dehydrogenase [Algicola sp.]